jgi:hypothetical protein
MKQSGEQVDDIFDGCVCYDEQRLKFSLPDGGVWHPIWRFGGG